MNWLPIARAWTRHAPFPRGKDRLAGLAMRWTTHGPKEVCCRTTDGRQFLVDPTSHGYASVYFKGSYEAGVSTVVSRILRSGDVCLDIGAHIGWYTTMFATLVGPAGAVHAFEPLGAPFEKLERNVALLEDSAHVVLNRVAMGARPGAGQMHVFAGLPDGHSSLADFGRLDAVAYRCPVSTVDDYLAESRLGTVTLAKLDIEGAELLCLQGARQLFTQSVPPFLVIEMALATSAGFGYMPNDILAHIQSEGDYMFFVIGQSDGRLTRVEAFARGDAGDNVLCVPRAHGRDGLAALVRRA